MPLQPRPHLRPDGLRRQMVLAWRDSRARNRNLLLLLFVILTTLILPTNDLRHIEYEVGRTWQDADLYAPLEFPIRVGERQYLQAREEAQARVPMIYAQSGWDPQQGRAEIDVYFDQLAPLRQRLQQLRPNDEVPSDLRTALEGLRPRPNAHQLAEFVRRYGNLQPLRQKTLHVWDSLYTHPIADQMPADFTGAFVGLRVAPRVARLRERPQLMLADSLALYFQIRLQAWPEAERQFISQLLQVLVRPTHRLDLMAYNEEVSMQLKLVPRYYGQVKKGDLIVQRGQMITPEIAGMLQSMAEHKAQEFGARNWWGALLGRMLLVALVTGITVLFLSLNRREIYLRNKQISLLLFMYFFMVGLTVLVHILGRQLDGLYNVNYYYIIPLSMAPILLTVFFDDRVGFFSNLIIAVLASLVIYNSFAFFLIQMVGGSVAVFNLATLRRRSQFFTTALYMLMVYVLAYLGINLYIQGSLQDINPLDLALLTINVLFTLSTFPLIYLFERLFGITSDLTYMELLDTSHPLLKEMATVAPGTYQHSLQVATIAEEVAKKVGANALLCHAGALFHDIGKMYNPDYFTENQHSGQNPHKLIGPLQSSVIIIDHVTRGAKLAREYRLPPEMVEFINTHHGTSRVEYFYQQYRKENPEAPTSIERDFRYPGPLPVTKEQAIVMIADSIEASARSLKNPTPEVLAAHVEKIVNGKIQDNQLVHARITFRDLNKIKREILKLLQSIYHTRISYPDASPTAPAAGDAEAAAPAQPAVEDAPSPVPAPVEAPPAAQAAPNSAIESKPETA